jgi:hypothetical protein
VRRAWESQKGYAETARELGEKLDDARRGKEIAERQTAALLVEVEKLKETVEGNRLAWSAWLREAERFRKERDALRARLGKVEAALRGVREAFAEMEKDGLDYKESIKLIDAVLSPESPVAEPTCRWTKRTLGWETSCDMYYGLGLSATGSCPACGKKIEEVGG